MRRLGVLAGVVCLMLLAAAGRGQAQSDPPAAPSVSSVISGYQSLSVGWVVPSGVNAADITAFDLRHIRSDASDKTDANWSLTEDLTTARPTTILTGLTNGVQYDVQVRVVTAADGAWSSTSTGTPGSPGGSFATATDLTAEIDVVGHLSSASDADYFKFEVDSNAAELVLYTSGPRAADDSFTAGTVDTKGTLYDAARSVVVSEDGSTLSHGANNFLITEALDTGDYYVKVESDAGNTGTYRLRLRVYPDTSSSRNARTVKLDSFYNGILGPVGGSSGLVLDGDYFKLVLTEETYVRVYTRGHFDTVLALVTPGDRDIFLNDDGPLVPYSNITTKLRAGTHYFRVTSFLSRVGGFYSLHFDEVDDPGSTVTTATPIELGGIDAGKITSTTDADYFSFTLDETKFVILDSFTAVTPQPKISATFLDSSQTEIELYRISGTSLNTSIQFINIIGGPTGQMWRYQGLLEAGDYYIKLTSSQGTGPYTMRLHYDASFDEFLDACDDKDNRADAPSDPFYGCQWHLNNDGLLGSGADQDINVETVWETVTGEGINIAIVDEALDSAHEDLKDNVVLAKNHNYDTSKDFFSPSRYHGTRVAGLIAARHNDVGVRGVAPLASIYGYNLLNVDTDIHDTVDAMTRNATTTAVSNNSWGPGDDGTFRTVSSLWERAIEQGLSTGFGGKGTVYVWAAGNGGRDLGYLRPPQDYSNLDEYANFYGVTAVCAVNYADRRSDYSERGSNLWVCAPSSGTSGAGITTTDNANKYTNNFGGTSAATPIVSGVVALMRAANGELTWRDVKLILAASARKNDPSNGRWADGALLYGSDTQRYSFNHDYGFGVVDAAAAVGLADGWVNVPAMRETTVSSNFPAFTVPGSPRNRPRGETEYQTRSLTVTSDIDFTEFVEVNVDFQHDFGRDWEIVLVSPSGAESLLSTWYFVVNAWFDGSFRFGSARHLGEDPSGEWQLKVRDRDDSDNGVLRSWSITVYGHRLRPGESDAPTLTAGDASLAVAWSAPTDIGASAITSYDLRHIESDANDKSDSNWTTVEGVWSTGDSALTYTLAGLANNNTYDVAIRAVNARAAGPWSDPATATPRDPQSPRVSGTKNVAYPESRTSRVGSYSASNPNNAASVALSLTGRDSGDFDFSNSGVLTFTNQPDFEAPTDANSDNVYHVDIEADDGTHTGVLHVVVTVEDVDEPPEIGGNIAFTVIDGNTLYETDYRENGDSPVGSFFGDDPENPGQSADFIWSLAGDDRGDFNIDSGAVTFVNSPDFEAPADSNRDNVYVVNVRATDKTGQTGQRHLIVTVTNANEPPVFSSGDSEFDYGEDDTGALGSYRATDPERTTISWSLSGDDSAEFEISDSGVLTFADQPDFEAPTDSGSNNVYNVNVVASDGSNTIERQVTVTVTDADEPPDLAPGDARVDYREDSTSEVESFSATDPEGASVTWSLSGSDRLDFELSSSGELSFADQPDFEAPADSGGDNVYNVVVEASDGAKTSRSRYTVTVTNVDETGTVALSLLQPQVETALRATASDPDGIVGAVTWAWHRSATGSSGWSVIANADSTSYTPVAADANNYLRATASYTDRHGPTKTARAISANTVEAKPGTVNNEPKFSGNYTRTVPENTPAGQDIGSPVTAEDLDDDKLTYTLRSADAPLFSIDAATGQIQTKAELDFESRSRYQVMVTATDPTGDKDTQQVTINLENVDEAPTVTSSRGATVRFDENSTRTVASFRATDPERETLTWGLAATGDHDLFEINTSGVLSFKTPPDYEQPQGSSGNSYSITVTATESDANVPVHTGQLDFTVIVDDDDEPPVISGSATVDYREDSTSPAGIYTASDPEGADVSWSLTGADRRHFTINDGELSFAAQPDFETRTSYRVSVQATDETNHKTSLAVAVNITNHDEPPLITGPDEIFYSQLRDDAVAQYRATDPENATTTWNLAGADSDDFEFDNGVLTFKNQPVYDPNTDNQHSLTIEATDQTSNTGQLNVTVTVTEKDPDTSTSTPPPGAGGGPAPAPAPGPGAGGGPAPGPGAGGGPAPGPEPEPEPEPEAEDEPEPEPEPEIRTRTAACEPEPGNSTHPFNDVPTTSFAANDIGCIAELEITTGTSDTTYSPTQTVTREQMAAFLARLYEAITGQPAPLTDTPFTDIARSSFAFHDIGRIYGLGITTGTSDTTYSPTQTVTREQMAAFLARLYEAITGQPAPLTDTPFTDIARSSFAFHDIGRIYGLGITTGTSDTAYSPTQTVTREQMAAFLTRLYRALTEPSS